MLVRDDTNHYRQLVADSRGATPVESVTPTLTRQASPYDQRSYIELGTIKGTMHFAPRKGILATEQAQYALDVLNSIQTSLPPTQQLDGV